MSGVDKDLIPGTTVGEYRIEVKLGEGGFGAVYRAVHPLIGKSVAIKVLSRELSAKPEIVARFVDEARAVNQIRNRGIIDIFSFGGLPDGRQYFVMELLEGLSLDAYVKRRGRLAVEEALPILRGVARAVDAAHAAGIAHRDLKPDNVFLIEGADGIVQTKLLDFGVAKLLGERSGPRTQTGVPIGTPHYMSPEQSRGVDVDSRTDVYSFGVMAYEMLTGRLPFEGEAVMDILMKQITAPAEAPSKLCSELPQIFDGPILRMLEKERDKRPASLMAAVEELTQAARGAGLAIPQAPTVSLTSLEPPREVSTQTLATAQTLVGSSSEVGRASTASTSRTRRLMVGVVAASSLLAGVLLVLLLRSGPDGTNAAAGPPASARSSAAPIVASPLPSASSPTERAEVSITFEGQPPGTRIFRGTQLLGAAPGTVHLPKGSGEVELKLEGPSGYLSKTMQVGTDANTVISVPLDAAPKAAPSASHGPNPKPTGSSDLENPF
jgi:serine/threonine-protein kinase